MPTRRSLWVWIDTANRGSAWLLPCQIGSLGDSASEVFATIGGLCGNKKLLLFS